MLVVRDIFQCKYGKGGALVDLFKEARDMLPAGARARIMSDASGQFDTIVTEWVLDDFAAWQRMRDEEFSSPEFPAWFGRMMEIVESGRREFYYIEAEI